MWLSSFCPLAHRCSLALESTWDTSPGSNHFPGMLFRRLTGSGSPQIGTPKSWNLIWGISMYFISYSYFNLTWLPIHGRSHGVSDRFFADFQGKAGNGLKLFTYWPSQAVQPLMWWCTMQHLGSAGVWDAHGLLISNSRSRQVSGLHDTYPLLNIQKTMENHHCS